MLLFHTLNNLMDILIYKIILFLWNGNLLKKSLHEHKFP
jgi:hypothetical protein